MITQLMHVKCLDDASHMGVSNFYVMRREKIRRPLKSGEGGKGKLYREAGLQRLLVAAALYKVLTLVKK